MKLRTIFLIAVLASVLGANAQKLTVEKMAVAPMDLSASKYERKDLTGKPCALVKVQLATTGAQFEGNVIGKSDYKTGEYWVYMSEGSYLLSVKHPSFVPLDVNFRDYGINGVKSKTTYKLTLLMPQGQEEKTQKLTINYTPVNAIVVVDSKTYQGDGHLELTLPIGTHDYQIVAMGYDTVEGSVKLNASSPSTITLTATKQQAAKQAEQPTNQEVPVSQKMDSKSIWNPVSPTVSLSSAPSSSASSSAVETITVKGVSFNMVRVEGGTFQMGATAEMIGAWEAEKPVHQVTLSSYNIGETEVTQELWEAVMGSNPSYFKGTKRPVEQVKWEDICGKDGRGESIDCFLYKLNKITGRHFRLPTEAEWEYAARGGNKSGKCQYSGSDNADDVAWTLENSDRMTHDVATKQANELGLYDMSGNVWEWCQDKSGSYSRHSQTNPTGSATGSIRVTRGGDFINGSWFCRPSFRFDGLPSFRLNYIGFRLAL